MLRGSVLGVIVLALGGIQGPPPLIQNGRVDVRQGTSIDREIAGLAGGQTEPVWIGWRVPMADGHRAGCCVYSDDSVSEAGVRGCFVESPPTTDGRTLPQIQPASRPVPLEGGTGLVILLRVVDGRPDRLRNLGDDCPLDAGGRTVYWLPGATPAESVRFLASVIGRTDAITREQAQRLKGAAISAIALHQDPAAVDALLATARRDADPDLRADAAYWLGQRGGAGVIKDVRSVIDADANDTVKRRAVQGLARLPEPESTSLLIDLAQSNRSLAVRKAAVTALGRSKDPRALAYLEGLLRR